MTFCHFYQRCSMEVCYDLRLFYSNGRVIECLWVKVLYGKVAKKFIKNGFFDASRVHGLKQLHSFHSSRYDGFTLDSWVRYHTLDQQKLLHPMGAKKVSPAQEASDILLDQKSSMEGLGQILSLMELYIARTTCLLLAASSLIPV